MFCQNGGTIYHRDFSHVHIFWTCVMDWSSFDSKFVAFKQFSGL
jgi:hypothetical protein